jgi:imidazolonepropionase-like amidohydrolase
MKSYFVTSIIIFFVILNSVGLSSDQIPAKPQERPVVIANATIHPVSGPVIENGLIVFDKGRIAAIGSSVVIPNNAERIDAAGKHVYPGLISAETYIGLTEIEAVRASRDRVETGRINPNVRAETAFNPESELIPVTRANGILTVVASPAGPLIAGTGAVMEMDGWTWEDMTLRAPAGLYVAWPNMVTRRGPFFRQSEEEQIKERERSLKELADAFRDARAYMAAKRAEHQRGVPYHDVDVRWEAMGPVLEGEVPVMVRASDVQQIQAAVAWSKQERVRLIIVGGHEAWRLTDLLKENDVPVLAGGIHRLPSRRFNAYDDPFTLPLKLHQAGVKFAIFSADEAAHQRNLPYEAAMAAAYGLPKEEALKAITLYPAQILGVDDRVGSLEVGKDATLIVTNGDPLEITTDVELAFIRGGRIDLTSRHTKLYEKYKEKYGRMKDGK